METSKFSFSVGLTYDDILLKPGFTDFKRENISLQTQLTQKIRLQIPFVSSPMDTVTESRLAIALGKCGGIGIIHRNLSIEDQVKEVQKVKKEKILVGAAVGPYNGVEDRLKALVAVGVDAVVIDSAHGFTSHILKTIDSLKKKNPKLSIIVGSIATKEAARALINSGADALRVGVGPGAICTTRIVSGMGVPQVTAISDVVSVAKKAKIPVIADGGIRQSGDVTKALALGASTVMMGSFFAESVESPGEVKEFKKEEVPARFLSIFNHAHKTYMFKQYRGMGSDAAMQKGAKIKVEDEFHGKDYSSKTLIAEGVEGYVPIKGTVEELLEQALGGLRSGMYYAGAKTIPELWKKAEFYQITQASLFESHPHSLIIDNPGKSYL